jgi:hypothetical protein
VALPENKLKFNKAPELQEKDFVDGFGLKSTDYRVMIPKLADGINWTQGQLI